MKKYCFQIAGVVIELDSEIRLDIDDDFQAFQILAPESADFHAELRRADSLPYKGHVLMASDYDNEVYLLDEESFVRYFHLPEKNEIYAVSYCNGLSETKVYYLDSARQYVNSIHQYFRMSCWEAAMNRNERLLLHASLLETGYGGILFSGPSGIGKSTQADLWCKYRDARLINGDRPILHKEAAGNRWVAYGSPLAGSSRCCLNEGVPVSAIILLKQSLKCSVRKVEMAEAFKRLYSLSTVYSWSSDYVDRVLFMIQNLILEIPVYELSCTPDEMAIETLECVLQGGSSDGTV